MKCSVREIFFQFCEENGPADQRVLSWISSVHHGYCQGSFVPFVKAIFQWVVVAKNLQQIALLLVEGMPNKMAESCLFPKIPFCPSHFVPSKVMGRDFVDPKRGRKKLFALPQGWRVVQTLRRWAGPWGRAALVLYLRLSRWGKGLGFWDFHPGLGPKGWKIEGISKVFVAN